EFVDELSTWYLRLSRDRLKGEDRHEMSQVFGYALYTLAQLFAPISPFFPELVHQTMVDEKTSIHHTDWPTVKTSLLHPELEEKMTEVKKVVEQGRAMRTDLGLKLRQPLSRVTVTSTVTAPKENLLEVVKQELNVKNITWTQGSELVVEYDTLVTPELKAEGEARELMRSIQQLRRKAGLKVDEVVTVEAPVWPESWQGEIENKTKTKLVKGSELKIS
ncbi:MAG TPA: class I tRNA ligase family protein, partial [Patescibacteria group bacterium]